MTVDPFGGVWVTDPWLLLAVSAAALVALGWAHRGAAGIGARPHRKRLAGVDALCDDLLAAVGRVVAEASRGRPRATPMPTPYATWRRTPWSQGRRRLYRGRPPRVPQEDDRPERGVLGDRQRQAA